MRVCSLSFAVGAVLAASPASANERLLNPIADWQLKSTGESCLLVREFADHNGDQIRLNLQFFWFGDKFLLTMVGNGLPLREGGQRGVARFRYRFKPHTEWREGFGATGYSKGADLLTFQGDFAPAAEPAKNDEEDRPTWEEAFQQQLVRVAQIQQLSLAYPTRDDTILQLGPLAEPLTQIHNCVKSMVMGWGYDPAALERARTGPKLLNGSEMVGVLIQKMRRARVGNNDPIILRMVVDETGKATGCKVQHPQRGNKVEALICQVVQDVGQFAPALDSDGKAILLPYVNSIVFQI